MLTLIKQTNGNYHLGFANSEDRKMFIQEYNLEKIDKLIQGEEWKETWNCFNTLFSEQKNELMKEAKVGSALETKIDSDVITECLENYFCNGFTNLTGYWTYRISFVDNNCEHPFDEYGELNFVSLWWQEHAGDYHNLIEYLLENNEIIFYRMTDSE